MEEARLKKEAVLSMFGSKLGIKLLNWLDPCCDALCNAVQECGAGGSNLQEVTDNGNVTTNSILVGVPYTGNGTVISPFFEILAPDNNTLEFSVPALGANRFMQFPGNNGINGNALITNGAGILSWGAPTAAPGGSPAMLQFNNAGVLDGIPEITWVPFSSQLFIGQAGNSLAVHLPGQAMQLTNLIFSTNSGFRPAPTVQAFGTNLNLGGNHFFIYFSGSTGAATVSNLNGLATGHLLVVTDLDRIASTSNITIDAGAGNTISSPAGVAQTYVINTNGGYVMLHKVTSTQWAVVNN